MKSPAFRFYPSDFWGSPDVQVMDLHEVGAYVSLLSAAWSSDRPGSLPDDDERLRRWARMSREQWQQSRDTLLSKFPIGADGWRVNPRLLHEAAKQEAFSASQTEKANRRWAKETRDNSGTAPAMPEDMPGHVNDDAGAMPSVSVSVFQNKNNTSEPAALSLGEEEQKQTKGTGLGFPAKDLESIWKLWPVKAGKQQGLASIRRALKYLAASGVDDPVGDLTSRVRTWLAWHARQVASGTFVPAIGHAQGWFGDKQRRYLDPDAEPPAETMLLIDGKRVPQSQCEADGWNVIRGDA